MAVKRNSQRADRTRKPLPQNRTSAAAGLDDGGTSLSEEEIRGMVAKAAYLRAERRGFAPGSEMDDWLAAEREIVTLLGESRSQKRPVQRLDGQAAFKQEGALLETRPADATAR
jgi:hypothetical protein